MRAVRLFGVMLIVAAFTFCMSAEAKIKVGKAVAPKLREAYLNHAFKVKIEPKAAEIAQFINQMGCAIVNGKPEIVTAAKVLEVVKAAIKNTDIAQVESAQFAQMTKSHSGAVALGISSTLREIYGYELPGKQTNHVIALKEGSVEAIPAGIASYPMSEKEYEKYRAGMNMEKLTGAELHSRYESYKTESAQGGAHELMHIAFTQFGNPALGMSSKEIDELADKHSGKAFLDAFGARDRKISLNHHAFLTPYYWAYQLQNNIWQFKYEEGKAPACGSGQPGTIANLSPDQTSEAQKKLSSVEDPSFTKPAAAPPEASVSQPSATPDFETMQKSKLVRDLLNLPTPPPSD